jgi:signal peptidase II
MQAARGTSLSHDDSSLATENVPSRARALGLMAAVFAVLYAVDQATKALAVEHLSLRSDVSLVGDVLVLHLTRNAGAAFSAGTGYTEVFSVLAILAVVVVLWLSRRLHDRVWAVAFGLLLAGICGNLTDRMVREPGPLRGHVVDFLMLPHWPIFNVADMCINVAAALILVQAYRGIRLDGSRAVREPADEPDTTHP